MSRSIESSFRATSGPLDDLLEEPASPFPDLSCRDPDFLRVSQVFMQTRDVLLEEPALSRLDLYRFVENLSSFHATSRSPDDLLEESARVYNL